MKTAMKTFVVLDNFGDIHEIEAEYWTVYENLMFYVTTDVGEDSTVECVAGFASWVYVKNSK